MRIETTPINSDWKRNLDKAGFTFETVCGNGSEEDLKTKLLEIGGEAVILVYDLSKICPRLTTDGKMFKTGIYDRNPVFDEKARPYMGFGLFPDGCWRYRTWWVQGDSLVVDLETLCLAYYGVQV